MDQNNALRASLARLQQISIGLGVVGLGICAAGFFVDQKQFFQSYLMGNLFWIQVSAGCMGILMAHHLAGGKWGGAVQRVIESAVMVFPVLGLLFIPVLLGIPTIYEWAMPEAANDPIIQLKSGYLNVPFFAGRAVFYFVFWSVLAYLLNKNSLELDETGSPEVKDRMKNISGPGMLFFCLSVSFAAFDWGMSLEPHWYSTIYGFHFGTGAANAAFAFIIILLGTLLLNYKPFSDVVEVRQINDYANFLFGAVMTWGYSTLCQGLIIWSGDVAEFTPWYVARTTNGWENVFIFLVVFHFVVPWFLLLLWPVKRNIKMITLVAVLVVIVQITDNWFYIAPAHVFNHESPYFDWMYIAALIGVGGIWMATFSYVLGSKPSFMPLNDKIKIQEQTHHGTQNRAATHSY
jgi:hypothetical protein